jgi:hypothetical protein
MTYSEAKDELYGVVNDTITANLADTVKAIEIRWPAMGTLATPPPVDGYWARIYFNTLRDMQASLSKDRGISRYEALGSLLVQIYSPISIKGSVEPGNFLAEAIQAAFRRPSPSGAITFTNQMVREVGNNTTHYITNVSVDCTYDNFQ